MPNIASAAKRHRQSLKRRSKNRAVKSELKTEIRQVREASAAGKIEQAEADFRLAVSKIDRAAGKRIIHPNRAARIKSRLSASLKAAKKK
jgi:small subunit ribosomal protein S20